MRIDKAEVDVPPQRHHVPEQHSVIQRNELEVHRLSDRPHLHNSVRNYTLIYAYIRTYIHHIGKYTGSIQIRIY